MALGFGLPEMGLAAGIWIFNKICGIKSEQNQIPTYKNEKQVLVDLRNDFCVPGITYNAAICNAVNEKIAKNLLK